MGKTFSQDQDVTPPAVPMQSFEIKNLAFADCSYMAHLCCAILLIKLSEDQRSIHFIRHRLYFGLRHIKERQRAFLGFSQANINATSVNLLEAFSLIHS